jgi:hypothetical protein
MLRLVMHGSWHRLLMASTGAGSCADSGQQSGVEFADHGIDEAFAVESCSAIGGEKQWLQIRLACDDGPNFAANKDLQIGIGDRRDAATRPGLSYHDWAAA